MRSMFRTMLVAMLAVFALSAVAASAAQAEEAPFYKIAGTRLAAGESKAVTVGKAGTVTIDTEAYTVKCSLNLASGAKLLGSNVENHGSGEMTVELSKCSVEKPGCSVIEPLQSQLLQANLVSLGEKGKGTLGLWLEPKGTTKFMLIKLNKSGCTLPSEIQLLGSAVAEIHSGGKPVEAGKEPAEAKTLELVFPENQIKHLWMVHGGVGSEYTNWEEIGLRSGVYGEAQLSSGNTGATTLELAGSPSWGVFD